MADQQFSTIFDKMDHSFKAQRQDTEVAYDTDIYCSYKDELSCYVFYRKNGEKLLSAAYVTQTYREETNDANALEATVINYLKNKEGMQATFKSTGIDEAPLV